MARRLAHGESSPKSKSFSERMSSRQEKHAVALMQVANVCGIDSIKEAAAGLYPIVQKSYFKALDTPFIPYNILSMVNKNDMAIRQHWQRDFSPLAPYAVAHASMCVHPRFLHKTIFMEVCVCVCVRVCVRVCVDGWCWCWWWVLVVVDVGDGGLQ